MLARVRELRVTTSLHLHIKISQTYTAQRL